MFNLKLEQLKVFIAIAGSGSISDAAPKVSRSPAAVSMTLSQMEKQLGGKLFVGERKSKLTPLGRTVLTNAQRVMEEYQRALTNIQLFAEGRQGHVKIAVVPSVAIRILPLAVAELREEYPAVTIDIRDTDSQSIHQQVENGIVDFGIASHPGHDLLYSDYLYEDRFQLVSPRAHPLCARKGGIRVRDLDAKEFIVNGLCEQIEHARIRQLIADSRLYIHNTLSILSFIESGFGYTILPSLVISNRRGIVANPIKGLDLKRRLYVICKNPGSLSPLAGGLIENLHRTVTTKEVNHAER